ncbi:MAG: hypothetical protein QXO70_04780 [Candidatus Pacearchaeota archaeon]
MVKDIIEDIAREEELKKSIKRKARQEQKWYSLLKLASKTNETLRSYIKEGHSFEEAITYLQKDHLDLYCCWLLAETLSSFNYRNSKWYEKSNNAKRIIYESIDTH